MSFTMWDISGCCCGAGDCEVCVTVTEACSELAVSGVTITLRQGGSTVDTCTTDANGQCCITGLADGDYNLEATKANYIGSNKDISVACPGTTNVALTVDDGTGNLFGVEGCGQPIPGATLTIQGGSYTTDANGQVIYSAPAGDLAWTVTADRYAPDSGTQTHTCTGTEWGTTLTPATGYQCIYESGAAGNCTFPAPETLSLTDSVIGSCSLTWNGTDSVWRGTISYSFPGFCGCAAKSTTVEYTLDQLGGLTIRYKAIGTCPDDGLGWGWSGQPAFDVVVSSCPPAYAATVTLPSICTCSGSDCTVAADRWYRLWGASAPTITITE